MSHHAIGDNQLFCSRGGVACETDFLPEIIAKVIRFASSASLSFVRDYN